MAATHEQLYAAAYASLASRPQAILREMYERHGVIPTQAEVKHGRAELDARAQRRQAQLQLRYEQLRTRYEAVMQRLDEQISSEESEQSEQ